MFSTPSIESILLLAPHLCEPPMNGGDVYVCGISRYLSTKSKRLTLVTASEIVHYAYGIRVSSTRYQLFGRRSLPIASLRTLALGSHYLVEAFNTQDFKRLVALLLNTYQYQAILCSYISTAKLAVDILRSTHSLVKIFVLTHNNEFKWYSNFSSKSYPFYTKLVANSSLKWLKRHISDLASRCILVHITASDDMEWRMHIPDHYSIILPPGIALSTSIAPEISPYEPIRLLFVGSLSSQMNIDCLNYFADYFYPLIHKAFAEQITIHVVGSNPPPIIVRLCRNHGWTLRANLSDEEVDTEFLQATFSLLPFEYSNGAKLKLLKSISYGIPVLATTVAQSTIGSLPLPNLVSDSPASWVDHIHKYYKEGISCADRTRICDFARPYTWESNSRKLIEALMLA